MLQTTAVTPPRQRKPRPKPERRIRLFFAPEGKAPGVLRITVGTDAQDYFVTRVASDFGDGFLLEKVGSGEGGERAGYHVHLAPGDAHTCECKGFLRWNHCKHTDGLQALRAAGKL